MLSVRRLVAFGLFGTFGAFGTAARAQTPAAAAQIAQVQTATRPLATPAAARAAGFEPAFEWLPTMGTHWVSVARMRRGAAVQLTQPSQLMFSPIAGRDSLVGAAYAYLTPLADSARPAPFDGAPAWHEHPNLAPAGQTLTMLHVWFVPSPDGPFAGHNPNLPFWALGLEPPPAERVRDAAVGPTIRKAALALGEIVDTTGLFPVLAAREPLHARLAALRDSVRLLVPELRRAESAKDRGRWEEVATRAAAQWDAIRAAYLGAAPAARLDRMRQAMDEMAGAGHAHAHMPGGR